MARKLSNIARQVSIFFVSLDVSLAALSARAESEVQVPAGAKVVVNPHTARTSQPQIVAEEPVPLRRGPITYHNPFAAMSKAPPTETPLRPGPVSRWRRSVVTSSEPSPVEQTILSADPIDPAQIPWDQLPPPESLRAAAANGADAAALDSGRFTHPSDAIQFATQPLTQPNWLTSDADIELPVVYAPLDASVKDITFQDQQVSLVGGRDDVTAAFASDVLRVPATDDEQLSAIVSDQVDSPECWLEQAQQAAQAAQSVDELSTIVALCQRGMRSGPDADVSRSLRRLEAWARNRRGELLVEADRPDDAINDFQLAISLDPQCSLAIHNRAVTLAQSNQFAAALRDFNRVIELNPGLAVAYRNRAELLAALGRMDEAVADYNRAIDALPADAAIFRGRAYALQRLGRFDDALSDMNRSIELAPNEANAYAERGNLAAEQGVFDQALSDFRRALSIDPNGAEANRSLAWLLATCSDPQILDAEQSLSAAERARKLAPPDDYLILDTLAAALASAGRYRDAVPILQQALAAAPPEYREPLKQRLALYEKGEPYVSRTATPAAHADSNESR